MKLDLLFSNFPFISCDKVTLSRITDIDTQSLWELMSDDETFRYSPSGAFASIDAVSHFIAEIDYAFKIHTTVTLGIFSNAHLNKLIGVLSISNINPDVQEVTFDIMLNQSFIGQGNAAAAVDATMKFLFDVINVNRVQAFVMPINYACKQMLERCGFVKEGTIREGFFWADKGIVDLDLYAMIPMDYLKYQNRMQKRSHYKF